VDLVHGAPAAKWTRGSLQRHLARPLALPTRTRIPGTLRSRHATPPRHAPRRWPLRPLAVVRPGPKSTAPSRYFPRPGAPWPIRTPRAPPSCAFFSFFLLPPPRNGRRDLARADRPPQPYIVPSNHRSSFSTFHLRSTRAESNPIPLPTPFPFCAAAGELGLTADRPAQRESVHDSYPRCILKLTRCSCVPLPRALLHLQRRQTEQPPRH